MFFIGQKTRDSTVLRRPGSAVVSQLLPGLTAEYKVRSVFVSVQRGQSAQQTASSGLIKIKLSSLTLHPCHELLTVSLKSVVVKIKT